MFSLARVCFLFLRVLKCFTSPGLHMRVKRAYYRSLSYRVSPFGNLRIKACSAAPRSLSQLRYVLHRHKKPRHPPYALDFPLGNLHTTITFLFCLLVPAEIFLPKNFRHYNFFPDTPASFSFYKVRGFVCVQDLT